MKKISNGLYQISSGWVTLAALMVFLLFSAFVLPEQAAKAETYTEEAGSPDSSLFYTANQLYQFAESYGPQGRQAYIRARWTFDVIWPLVYTAFLATSISWLMHKAKQRENKLKFVNLIPISGMLLDFLENVGTSIIMARFPLRTPILAQLTGYFTTLKWLLIVVSFAALFFALLLAVRILIKPSKQTTG